VWKVDKKVVMMEQLMVVPMVGLRVQLRVAQKVERKVEL